MRIGVFFPTKEYQPLDETVARIVATAEQGFASLWLPQSSGFDALTVLSLAGRETSGVELGTSVVPTYPRHPMALAAQALTTNAASHGRLVLGLGLSHRMAIEGAYGLSYDRPARHMREYLAALLPLLRDGAVDVQGETITARGQLTVPGASAPTVLLAALQPRMLALAGGVADGTITWCTGPVVLEQQIVPQLSAAAAAAGRPSPARRRRVAHHRHRRRGRRPGQGGRPARGVRRHPRLPGGARPGRGCRPRRRLDRRRRAVGHRAARRAWRESAPPTSSPSPPGPTPTGAGRSTTWCHSTRSASAGRMRPATWAGPAASAFASTMATDATSSTARSASGGTYTIG